MLSRQIAEAHGGTLTVADRQDAARGCEARLRLVAVKNIDPSQEDVALKVPGEGGRERQRASHQDAGHEEQTVDDL